MVSLKSHPAAEVKTPYTFKKDTTSSDTTVKDTTVKDTTAKDTSNAIAKLRGMQKFTTHLAGRTLFIAGASSRNSKIELFDMQGRPVFSSNSKNGFVDLNGIAEGLYVIQIHDGSASHMQRIVVK